MKKRSFTLMEVLIGLTLTAILLAVLFDFMKDLAFHQQKVIVIKEEVQREQAFRVKIAGMVEKIVYEEDESRAKKRKLLFCTTCLEEAKGSVLTFTFNNEVEPVRAFCRTVKAQLFLNPQNEVILEIHSLKEKGKKRSEVLFSQVEKMDWMFFDAREKNQWIELWPEKIRALPGMIKVHLAFRGGKELTYAFFLHPRKEKIPVKVI